MEKGKKDPEIIKKRKSLATVLNLEHVIIAIAHRQMLQQVVKSTKKAQNNESLV